MKLTRQEKKQIRKEKRQTRKNYNADLKALQKKYKPEKIDRVINGKARKIWMPYVKWDHNWDWTFIIDILLYKIELVKLYIKHFGNTIDEERNKQIAAMEDAVELYKDFTKTDWYKEANEFHKKHVYNYIYISENIKNLKDYKYIIPTAKDNLMFYDIDVDILSDKKRMAEAYAFAANVPKEALYDKNLIRSFGSEWDCEGNEKHYKELVEQAEKNKQKALDKFFLYVSKHVREWWD